ncbi:MAG: DUF177 domain-containing protein [Lentisphaerae bacterium]|nr:DUF177 domain-containing protein [Lentisphaerota bacterium]
MISFSVSALEKAPVHKQGNLPAEFLELAPDDLFQAAGEVEYDLDASLVSGGVLISGRLSVRLASQCGRCLKDISFPLQTENLHLFMELTEGMEIVEADEELRAELLLNLPMNPLCTPDCLGLCPECGCDLNEKSCRCELPDTAIVESPWNALDDLEL